MTTQPNKDIIARLLADTGTSIPNGQEENDTDTTSIASARVLSTRYKVYLLVMLIVIYLMIMYMFLPLLDKQQGVQSQLQNIVNQLQNFESKRLQYVADAGFMQKLNEQEETLLNCINNNIACDALDQQIADRKDIAALILKINNMSDPIMGLDEKRILASINDYLLIYQPNSIGTRQRNGNIQSIRIGDPIVYDGSIYRVPIYLSVQFANKDGLLSFINNTEKTVANNSAYRLFYVIDQIDYDVVKYSQEQTASIQLSLFYYNQ